MKEPVKSKGQHLPYRTQLKYRLVLAGIGAFIVIFVLLAWSGVVNAAAPQTSPYTVQTYNTGNQVSVTINLDNYSYQGDLAKVEIIANGVPLVTQNFTNSAEVSAFVSTGYSVSIYLYKSNSFVFDHSYAAPTSTAAVLGNYEKLAASVIVTFIAFFVGIRYGRKTRLDDRASGNNAYSESDMDSEARASRKISEVLLDVKPEDISWIREYRPDAWEKIESFAFRLSEAVIHSLGVKPDDFVKSVLDTEPRGKMNVDMDKKSGGDRAESTESS